MDINKIILAETMSPFDAEAFLHDLPLWRESDAWRQARTLGIELGEEHMEVLCFLRDHYSECGPAPSARQLLRTLETAFAHEGGRRYLFQLFPGGPVTQACALAGLPLPPGTADPSFGSVH